MKCCSALQYICNACSREQETVDHLYVNTTRADSLHVNFDISFHEIPCKMLSLDAVDDAGALQHDTAHEIFKHRLSPEGKQEGEPEMHSLGTSIMSESHLAELIKEHEEVGGVNAK